MRVGPGDDDSTLAGPYRSTRVTWWPRRASSAAVGSPHAPAPTTAHRVIYNTTDGTLWYDPNGSTGGNSDPGRVKFAQIDLGTKVAGVVDMTDFLVALA